MTAKTKAKAIFKKYAKGKDEQGWYLTEFDSCSKLCAIIAVNEIIEGIERAFDEYEKATGVYVKNRIFYWDFYSDVKSEIYKL